MRPSLNSQSAHQQHKWHVIHELDTMKSTRATNERDKYFQNHEQWLEETRAKQQAKKKHWPFYLASPFMELKSTSP
jgi:hypothetical protein